jgi:hypothetical protein
MVVPTGTATPWRELSFAVSEAGSVVYICDGWTTGSADLLAEALRADGVVRTLGPALRFAEEATLETEWYGYVDGQLNETLCNAAGETDDGNLVDEPRACIVATINIQD